MPSSLIEELPRIIEKGKKEAQRVLDGLSKSNRITLQTNELVLPTKAKGGFFGQSVKELEKKRKPSQLGGIVEKKLNILLKYLYRNYLLIGGPKKPDGYLFHNKKETYLLDSKQHKDICIGEIDKIARYLFSFCKTAQLPESSTGILIVCREKLGKTLNNKALDEWKNSEEFKQKFKISFISLEFLMELFELARKPVVNSNNKLRNKLLNSFYEVIKKAASLRSE